MMVVLLINVLFCRSIEIQLLAEALGNYKCGAIEVCFLCVGIAPLL
jgi:hypothetical protein